MLNGKSKSKGDVGSAVALFEKYSGIKNPCEAASFYSNSIAPLLDESAVSQSEIVSRFAAYGGLSSGDEAAAFYARSIAPLFKHSRHD